jgi:general secretion pathway protein D
MRFLPLNDYMRQTAFIVPALVLASSLGTMNAQNLGAIADREIVRRQEDLVIAEKLVAKGDKAVADKDYEAAYLNYLDALERIPAGTASGSLRPATLDKFSKAAIAYAEHLVATGRYSDAEKVAKTVLLPAFNPTYKPAVVFLSNLEQPDYYNKTVTPASAQDVEEVTRLLYEAEGFYQTGRYDLAIKRYEQVLNIDRYNIAARKGLEQVSVQKSKYYSNAYNETRSRMLWAVDQSWERPVRRFQKGRSTSTGPINRTGIRGTEAIVAKLNRIIIPRVDLQEATVREAVDFLQRRSRDLDTTAESPSERKGVNIVLKLDTGAPAPTPDPAAPVDPNAPPPQVGGNENTKITLALTNVPLIEALRYLTELSGLKYKIDPYAVSIVPLTENTTELVTKEYRVPPGFIPNDPAGGDSSEPSAGAVTADPSVRRIGARADAKTYLAQSGVPFPSGAFAQYVPAGSKLIVRNTPDAIDLVDYLVDAAVGVQPTQVEIESKFLEITQNNLKELGFDWLMGPVSLGGGIYGAGGTMGAGTVSDPTSPSVANFPFTQNGVPIGAAGAGLGGYPLTGGLRSGVGSSPSAAVSANSIDALLANVLPGSNFAAPAIFGVSGIFTNPQFQVVIRALDQRKGVDLMSAPKVTTKSGHKAIVRVVREFPYPTEFNPPEPPPPSTGGGTGSTIILTPGTITTTGVVTPTTPTAFETRNLGVTLEVEPVVGPDGYTIDLNLSPEVVEFDGFVNYGSPIFGAQYNPLTFSIDTPVLTENVINQPIFSTRKVTTSVSIWDGQTVALGGLIREDVQKVQDKVPLLGDVPLAGRLFRSNVDQKIKRNLIIFVTARLMDAEGRPVRQEDETEEIVEPLGLPQDIPAPAFDLGKGTPLK